MTPDTDPRNPRSGYLRRNDGSWSATPIVIGVAFIALFAYFVLGAGFNSAPDRSVTSKPTEIPRTTTTPTTPPIPTPAPKN